MKKLIKAFLVPVLFFLANGGYYLYKLHTLAIEGNRLFEIRCLYVNPILIDYKNAFLKIADTFKNEGKYSVDEVHGFYDRYLRGMEVYVSQESNWLELQKQYIERWDYKLIEPWYIQEAGIYQWKMYEGYRDDAKQILSLMNNPESNKKIVPGFVSEERQRRNEYSEKYFNFIKMAREIIDWRKYFGALPMPKGCTEENMTIPDTSGSIDWGPIKSDQKPVQLPPA